MVKPPTSGRHNGVGRAYYKSAAFYSSKLSNRFNSVRSTMHLCLNIAPEITTTLIGVFYAKVSSAADSTVPDRFKQLPTR